MFPMYRQLNLEGRPKLASDIKVLPENDGEIYRLWAGGDRWGCRKCNRTDDRFSMLEHVCKRNIKQRFHFLEDISSGTQHGYFAS